jgi:hypothetical protein
MEANTMTAEPTACVGFVHPDRRARTRERRSAVVVNLIATATLTLSIVIAVAAVSIGMARAVPPDAQGVAASMRPLHARPHVDLSRFGQGTIPNRRHG